MSIFWLNSGNTPVSGDSLFPEMHEDRYFLPGIIHGGTDYLIRVYLVDNGCLPEQFDVSFISRDLILSAKGHDPSLGESFGCQLDECCINYGCYNEGDQCGDFRTLVANWPKSVEMSPEDLVGWAEGEYKPKVLLVSPRKVKYLSLTTAEFMDLADELRRSEESADIAENTSQIEKYGLAAQGDIPAGKVVWHVSESPERGTPRSTDGPYGKEV